MGRARTLLVRAFALLAGLVASAPVATGHVLSMVVRAGEHRIVATNEGDVVEVEGFGLLMAPGKPMLPARTFLIALPPGATAVAARVEGIDARQLEGTYRLAPAPQILPTGDGLQRRQLIEGLRREWQGNHDATYPVDDAYPGCSGRLTGRGSLRKYSYAAVSFYPFTYHPRSGRLVHCRTARITVEYGLPAHGSAEARRLEELKRDCVADEEASGLFVNFSEVEHLYRPAEPPPEARETSDYVIITSAGLLNGVTASGFVEWKRSLGHGVRTVLTSDPEIADQPGVDLAAKIRSFLISRYPTWGIEYVLLVGSFASVPMRYCYPDPTNHSYHPYDPYEYGGEVPTDYYYADLSSPDALSWDSDGDGFFGEYTQDSPDFLAEVAVGRIPSNSVSRITYTLDKLVAFEQDTGVWKDHALHAGAMLFYDNEGHSGYPEVDGAAPLAAIEAELMTGWHVSRYSEQEGLDPSGYPWTPLDEGAFTLDWRDGRYGVVNWAGHGFVTTAARTIWSWDDGDGVPESGELETRAFINTGSSLEDDHPGIVFAVSCSVGYPEPNPYGRLGVDLLTDPALGASVGVISATRGAAAAAAWPTPPGGAQSMCQEFNRYMIQGPGGPERVGNALYHSKFFCNQNHGWEHYWEYKNMFGFNLYGDPALARKGAEPGAVFADGFESGDTSAWSSAVQQSGRP